MSFDWHREMTDAVVEAPYESRDRLVWIMSAKSHSEYCHFLEHEMGVEDDGSEAFDIPIEIGEPSNGEPFELVLRPTN
jgi:hypothetical protein